MPPGTTLLKVDMTENNQMTGPDSELDAEDEVFPVVPRYHPIHKIPRNIFDFLASAKLAMFLLVVILACSVAGVTIVREKRAWDLIFSTLWFNSLLVLLVVNVGCCFFGRIWGRRITLISFGMILFHLSFVTMFLGIVYNSLFYFRATIRMTEGETLPNGDYSSYDNIYMGRLFDIARAKGTTTLVKLHTGFKYDGEDKRFAYELAVGEPGMVIQDKIFITRHLYYKGFKYFPDSEGYSLLTILYDKSGKELYGAHLPLQSLVQKERVVLYTTGTKSGATTLQFPQAPEKPLFDLNVAYKPDAEKERFGEVFYQIWPLVVGNAKKAENPIADGKAMVGKNYVVGDYQLAVKEVRFWTNVAVRYEPGQPVILTSLWVAFIGITLTTLARMFKKRKVS